MKKRLPELLAVSCLALLAWTVLAPHAARAAEPPLVLVLPFQVNAGPDMPDAADHVPQAIATQMEQHGMKVVPLAAAAQLQRKNGETIDLAAARALGREAGATQVV